MNRNYEGQMNGLESPDFVDYYFTLIYLIAWLTWLQPSSAFSGGGTFSLKPLILVLDLFFCFLLWGLPPSYVMKLTSMKAEKHRIWENS
jgi:hypothetical protein